MYLNRIKVYLLWWCETLFLDKEMLTCMLLLPEPLSDEILLFNKLFLLLLIFWHWCKDAYIKKFFISYPFFANSNPNWKIVKFFKYIPSKTTYSRINYFVVVTSVSLNINYLLRIFQYFPYDICEVMYNDTHWRIWAEK